MKVLNLILLGLIFFTNLESFAIEKKEPEQAPLTDRPVVREPATESSPSFLSVSPSIETNFPIFLGAGLKLGLGPDFIFDVAYGFVPKPYYNTIASVGADIGDEPAYEGLINAGFEDNSALKATLFYRLPTASRRWSIGTSYYWVESEGRAEIDEVLTGITGKD